MPIPIRNSFQRQHTRNLGGHHSHCCAWINKSSKYGSHSKVSSSQCLIFRSSDRKPGITNYVIGTAFIVYGVIAEVNIIAIIFIHWLSREPPTNQLARFTTSYFQLIYVLDLSVMVRKQHRRLSCYKIMIALGNKYFSNTRLCQVVGSWSLFRQHIEKSLTTCFRKS